MIDWSAAIAAIAALVLAIAHGLPRILAAVGTFADASRERAKAAMTHAATEASSVDAIRQIAESVVASLEHRISALESDHESCRAEVRELRSENSVLRERVSELEEKLDEQALTIATMEGRIALLTTERDAARDQAETLAAERGKRDGRVPLAVDVVIVPKATRGEG